MTDDYSPDQDRSRMYEWASWSMRQDMIRAGQITPTKFDEQPPEWAREADEQ